MKRFLYPFTCFVLIFLLIWNFTRSFQKLQEVGMLEIQRSPTIVIDPGHGGEDGGTKGTNGSLEKDINLSISLYLSDILKENGYRVVMTRKNDTDLGNSSLNTVAERKKSDMQNRLEIINNSYAVLGISIHQNYFEESKYSGAQVFYSSENNENLAKNIQSSLVEILNKNNNRLASKIDGKYILDNANLPMVIVECGFLSNPNEADLLSTALYQKQVAQAIYQGILPELQNNSQSNGKP